MSYSQETRTDELPGDPPVEAGPVAEHRVHVVAEVLEAVDPGHGHGLQTHRGQQREPRRVVLQEAEDVDSAL